MKDKFTPIAALFPVGIGPETASDLPDKARDVVGFALDFVASKPLSILNSGSGGRMQEAIADPGDRPRIPHYENEVPGDS